jgi:para-nitrobenzyl esterase
MKERWIRLAAICLPLLICGLSHASTVRTESGKIYAPTIDGLSVYKGVPFAAPPLGRLRWQEPQPVVSWQGLRTADSFAPACMQRDVSMPGETPPAVSEDCLYLNIWVPAASRTSLPVLVWIYGGGYNSGSASMPLYWGDKLARKGVIVITIAYRVGVLGFLAHPELTRESPHHSSGNYGLMDQIAALRWIHRNIKAFGGDPNRVTIAGQSAGAMSVSMLMASPRAKGLFRGAIAESGGLFEPTQLAPSYLLANAERDGEHFVAAIGAESIDALRRLPADKLWGPGAAGIAHPVLEPYNLPASPYDAYMSRRQNDVPVLIGSNAEEARALVDVSQVKASSYDAGIAASFGQLPPPLLAAYAHTTDPEARQARLDFERDLRFGWDMWAWARLQAAVSANPAYYYYFEQKPPFPADSIYAGWGASHYAELWYVFDHLDQTPWRWTAADRVLSDAMSTYWVNFVKTGNPNASGLPSWSPFTDGSATVLHLGDPIAAGPVANLKGLSVFDAVYDSVRGSLFGVPHP